MTTARLEHALTRQTVTLADRIIGNYRTPAPTVRETQWKMAREALAQALAVNPDDVELKGALRYCDGHLHRINGEARKAHKQNADAQHEFTEAVSAFREAAELRPAWPDPFLGLMRTFIYGLEDVDRGADALKQAQRLGYTAGERETVQLADGYRSRATDVRAHGADAERHGRRTGIPRAIGGSVSAGDRSLLEGSRLPERDGGVCGRRSAGSSRSNSEEAESSDPTGSIGNGAAISVGIAA